MYERSKTIDWVLNETTLQVCTNYTAFYLINDSGLALVSSVWVQPSPPSLSLPWPQCPGHSMLWIHHLLPLHPCNSHLYHQVNKINALINYWYIHAVYAFVWNKKYSFHQCSIQQSFEQSKLVWRNLAAEYHHVQVHIRHMLQYPPMSKGVWWRNHRRICELKLCASVISIKSIKQTCA